MKQVASYIRVSSKGQNYELQREAILRRGINPTAWYAEKVSAKTNDRPELKRLIADARAGLISDLWLFKLDRLTRSGVSDTFAVVSELRKAGVTIHCVADGVTIKATEDMTSDLFIFALGLAARLEWVAKNDRIAAARLSMEAKGLKWGRRKRMTTQQVDTARRMRSEGSPLRTIAQAIGVPFATVGRALKAA